MSIDQSAGPAASRLSRFTTWGMFWLLVSVIAAAVFFAQGVDALLAAWQLPEYSHGPLIPVLSALMFLRQLKEYPIEPGPKNDRWVGLVLLVFAVAVGTMGKLANISDIVAYATIFWVGGLLLVSFGWKTGKHFWPPVVHLIYMLPLPGVVYYKLSASLQLVSSEFGVWLLQLLDVPVFLDGNIIDLGVLKLHVAEACSGLRYLFPILSFSYIFAVLYRGPMWHKAVLLISAVPITVAMNSVRIAIAGLLAERYGLEYLEGFTHFFEGWVIFLACIVLLFLLARLMLFFHPDKLSLGEALDLDTSGLIPQAMRITHVMPSPALVIGAVMMCAASLAWFTLPERNVQAIDREQFHAFPREFGEWKQVGPSQSLSESVTRTLGADDYRSITLARDGSSDVVGFFSAWYEDQSKGGVHSPEICLPGAGWEIAWLERTNIADRVGQEAPFMINRVIIQKGETRSMVFYWFEQKDRRIAWDFAAKFYLLVDGVTTGRTDGAMVRYITPINREETDADAEARLMEALMATLPDLPRFISP
jgi:exosortase D (VPLPA-CTERM-specific)